MSLLADERAAIAGISGAAGVAGYKLAGTQRLRLETLVFTYVTGTNNSLHSPVVQFLDLSGLLVAAIEDWNDVGDTSVVSYTYGIGLEAFCGTAASGTIVQNALPDTVLEGGAQIVLSSIDPSGSLISADRFLEVTLYGISETVVPGANVIPLLTPLDIFSQA